MYKRQPAQDRAGVVDPASSFECPFRLFNRDQVLTRTISGGVTVNDCLFHFTQVNQPMGGVGPSGSGAYHGEWGFRTFSKLKPVFYRSALNRLADLYPPYGAKIARLEKLMRFMS